jgi:hypothetical protein
MSATNSAQRLLRWVPAWRRPAPPQPDFADLGTAFGLDLATLPEPAASAAPGARRQAWWQRLSSRRTPAHV